MVVVEGSNVPHHVKRKGNGLGCDAGAIRSGWICVQGKTSGSRYALPWRGDPIFTHVNCCLGGEYVEVVNVWIQNCYWYVCDCSRRWECITWSWYSPLSVHVFSAADGSVIVRGWSRTRTLHRWGDNGTSWMEVQPCHTLGFHRHQRRWLEPATTWVQGNSFCVESDVKCYYTILMLPEAADLAQNCYLWRMLLEHQTRLCALSFKCHLKAHQFQQQSTLLLTGGSAPFVRRRCDCLASSATFTNTQTYLLCCRHKQVPPKITEWPAMLGGNHCSIYEPSYSVWNVMLSGAVPDKPRCRGFAVLLYFRHNYHNFETQQEMLRARRDYLHQCRDHQQQPDWHRQNTCSTKTGRAVCEYVLHQSEWVSVVC